MFRNLAELWKFRALIMALVGRHLNSRYRGSVLGFVWSFLNPLCLIAVYALVFKYYIRFDTVEHYTLFLFAGLLPWIWFSSGLLEATASISSGGSLITKAMFPPHILPAVAVFTNLANFIFAVPLLLGLMLLSGVSPSVGLLFLPVIILVELIFLIGLGFAFAALNVHYRDIQHILGNLLTLWFFLTPVIYPASNVPEKVKFTLYLNPVALFTQMYQEVVLDGVLPNFNLLFIATVISLFTFVVGNSIFNRYR
jgi:ABC-type polysaccharide/polyol phosphate export permease